MQHGEVEETLEKLKDELTEEDLNEIVTRVSKEEVQAQRRNFES